MRTNNTFSMLLAAGALIASTSAAAAVPGREVRIHEERFAELPPIEQQRVLEIKERLETIIATDRSSLDPAQRTELRSEWKELKGEMKEYNRNGSVVYISTGGLIIIILLLIIIL